ncbi:MAG TPA: 4-alpha-glucanotransferase, partial [bacterium]|nr:4-alpha-glucanotransferase [bacterium]
ASPAMWSIFQLQDLLGMDGNIRRADVESERINVPAQPNFYWRYRMHLTLEKLRKAKAFNFKLSQLVHENER